MSTMHLIRFPNEKEKDRAIMALLEMPGGPKTSGKMD
jgi:hypothetical protein